MRVGNAGYPMWFRSPDEFFWHPMALIHLGEAGDLGRHPIHGLGAPDARLDALVLAGVAESPAPLETGKIEMLADGAELGAGHAPALARSMALLMVALLT